MPVNKAIITVIERSPFFIMIDQRPDIVFVVLDTHRADRLGCYGNERGLSPNIDAFSAESALFLRAVAPAQWTVPTHASVFTGP